MSKDPRHCRVIAFVVEEGLVQPKGYARAHTSVKNALADENAAYLNGGDVYHDASMAWRRPGLWGFLRAKLFGWAVLCSARFTSDAVAQEWCAHQLAEEAKLQAWLDRKARGLGKREVHVDQAKFAAMVEELSRD